MKISMNYHAGVLCVLKCAILCGLLSVLQSSAEDKSVKSINLHHRTWGAADGVPGAVMEIVQTKDGYLWVRTAAGPYRFDGIRFESLAVVCQCKRDDSSDVWIHAGAKGGLWIGAQSGISFVQDHRFTEYVVSPSCGLTARFAEDLEGKAWVIGQYGLCSITAPNKFDLVPTPGRPNGKAVDIFADSRGTLWIKDAADASLYFRMRGETSFHKNQSGSTNGTLDEMPSSIAETPDGLLWDSGSFGLRRIFEGTEDANKHPLSFFGTTLNTRRYNRFKPLSLLGTNESTGAILADREGALWLATKNGVLQVPSPSTLRQYGQVRAAKGLSSYTLADGLSSDVVWSFLEDREGNIWIGTNFGLDRLSTQLFQKAPFPMKRQTQYAIGKGQDGAILGGNWDSALAKFDSQGVHVVPGLHDAQIQIIHGSREYGTWVVRGGEIWKEQGDTFVHVLPPEKWLDLKPIALANSDDGALWVSFKDHGIYRFFNNKWTDENHTFGIPENCSAPAFGADSNGTLWLGGGRTLYEYRKGQVYKHHIQDKPIAAYVLQVYGKHIWLGGLVQFGVVVDGKLHVITGENGEVFQRVSGIVETPSGDVWFNSDKGAGLIKAAEIEKALADPRYKVSFSIFCGTDGFDGYGSMTIVPNTVLGDDGRIWMATNKGIFSVDPTAYFRRAAGSPPATAIETIKASSQLYLAKSGLRLGANSSDIEIQYTALNLSLPERTQFRYQLSGVDRQWQLVGTRRQAYYNRLAPGAYRFSVTARNPDGEWNKSATELEFRVLPAFYETWWFRALVIAVFLVLGWILLKTQIERSNAEVRGRLSARLQERERIARDLHDTLLQGFHGLMLRFHVASELLQTPAIAGPVLHDALDKADSLMIESRERIRDLRYQSEEVIPLPEALAAAGEQMAQDYSMLFEASVEGTVFILNPLIKEEVYLVGREALHNAFRHSGGTEVEMEITFHPNWMRMRVRDNGVGIPTETIRTGGAVGHWGLSGMHERAQKIAAQFKVWNRPGSGCEIELQVAAAIAYKPVPKRTLLAVLWDSVARVRLAYTRANEEVEL